MHIKPLLLFFALTCWAQKVNEHEEPTIESLQKIIENQNKQINQLNKLLQSYVNKFSQCDFNLTSLQIENAKQ